MNTCSAPVHNRRCNSKNVYSVVTLNRDGVDTKIYYCLEHHSQRVLLVSRLTTNPDEVWEVLKEENLVRQIT